MAVLTFDDLIQSEPGRKPEGRGTPSAPPSTATTGRGIRFDDIVAGVESAPGPATADGSDLLSRIGKAVKPMLSPESAMTALDLASPGITPGKVTAFAKVEGKAQALKKRGIDAVRHLLGAPEDAKSKNEFFRRELIPEALEFVPATPAEIGGFAIAPAAFKAGARGITSLVERAGMKFKSFKVIADALTRERLGVVESFRAKMKADFKTNEELASLARMAARPKPQEPIEFSRVRLMEQRSKQIAEDLKNIGKSTVDTESVAVAASKGAAAKSFVDENELADALIGGLNLSSPKANPGLVARFLHTPLADLIEKPLGIKQSVTGRIPGIRLFRTPSLVVRNDKAASNIVDSGVDALRFREQIISKFTGPLTELYNQISPDDQLMLRQIEHTSNGNLKKALDLAPPRLREWIMARKNLFTDPLAEMLGLPKDKQIGFYVRRIFDSDKLLSDPKVREGLIDEIMRSMGVSRSLAEVVFDRKFAFQPGFRIPKEIKAGFLKSRKLFGGLTQEQQVDFPLQQIDNLYLLAASRKMALDPFLKTMSSNRAAVSDKAIGEFVDMYADRILGKPTKGRILIRRMLDVAEEIPMFKKFQSIAKLSPTGLSQMATTYAAIAKLGLRPATGILNLFQVPIFAFPRIAALAVREPAIAASAVRGYLRGYTRAGFKIMERLGLDDANISRLDVDLSRTLLNKTDQIVKKINDVGLFFLKQTEQVNVRGGTGFGAGIAEGQGIKGEEALRVTRRFNQFVNFSERGDRPLISFDPIGRAAIVLRSFGLKAAERVTLMSPLELTFMATILTAIGGPVAVPLARKWKQELDNTNPNLLTPHQRTVREWLDAIEKNSLSQRIGIDLSRSINPEFYVDYFEDFDKPAIDAVIDGIGGVAGEDARKFIRDVARTGDPLRSLIRPVAAAASIKRAVQVMKTGEIRDPVTNELIATVPKSEAPLLALGVTTPSLSKEFARSGVRRERMQERKEPERERILRTLISDPEKGRKDLEAFNKKNPNNPLIPTQQALSGMVEKEILTRKIRDLKSTPKSVLQGLNVGEQ